MGDLQPFMDWVYLKLLTWWYSLGLTKEQRAENKAALQKWEARRG